MFEWIADQVGGALAGNEFLVGGLILGLLGSIAVLLRKVPGIVGDWVRRQVSVMIEVRDAVVIEWMDFWLQEQDYGQRCRRLKAVSHTDQRSDDPVPRLLLTPGIGWHIVLHAKRPYLVVRNRDDDPPLNGVGGGGDLASLLGPRETLKVYGFGRDPGPARGLLEAARGLAANHDADRIKIYVNQWSRWTAISATQTRSLDSIVLPAGMAEDLVADAERFLAPATRAWYESRGIPYRRGYLFWGSPGGGKSSMVRALASKLSLRLYALDLGRRELGDSELTQLMSALPPRALVLVEDVDCLWRDRQARASKEGDDDHAVVTLSGFLNAIDGSIAAEGGRILILTTNYPEALDDALVRDGRVDRRWHFGSATPDMGRRLFLRFFPGADQQAEAFAAQIAGAGEEFSMAKLQGLLVRHSEDADRALAAAAEELTVQPKRGTPCISMA